MKKWKIAILSVLVLGIVAFVVYILFLINYVYSIVPGISVDYHSKEELTELYWQNKDLLNYVRNDVISSDSLMNAMNQEKDGDIGIYVKEDKQYFTDKEWADIVSVFEKLHPYMIMMERKGRPLIFYIVCGTQKQDSVTKRTYLYWFPNEEERKYHEEPGVFPDGVFTQIDGGWYIVEETNNR
jgi:hypothetical protein